MESNLDVRIAVLEGEIAAIRADMERACREFLQATHERAVGWLQQRVEQTVVANPEIAKLLGREELRRLKQELRRLLDQAPELVSSHVNRDHYWAHRPMLMDSSTALFNPAVNPYAFHGEEPPPVLDGAVAEVLRRGDALLEEFGFVTASRPPRVPTFPATRPRRTLSFEWSEPMKAALARYGDLYRQLRLANTELRPLRRKRTDSDAKRLWDEV